MPEFKANRENSRFIFWQRWLVYTSIVFALSGVLFAVYGNSHLFKFYNDALEKIFWDTGKITDETEAFRAFIYAPLGGTIACCYILLTYIAIYPFKRKELWARNAIIIGFGAWIIIDSAACIHYGVYFQSYLINGFSFLIKALPLVFTWKDFQKR